MAGLRNSAQFGEPGPGDNFVFICMCFAAEDPAQNGDLSLLEDFCGEQRMVDGAEVVACYNNDFGFELLDQVDGKGGFGDRYHEAAGAFDNEGAVGRLVSLSYFYYSFYINGYVFEPCSKVRGGWFLEAIGLFMAS